MMETISRIQQLLAESRFVDAQKSCELEFQQQNSTNELREFYFESLIAQDKPLPVDLVLDHVESLLSTDFTRAEHWFNLIDISKFHQRGLLLKIKILELKGKTAELYQNISAYQVLRFESRCPDLPSIITELSEKYFRGDYQLQLQRLALDLMRLDLVKSEDTIKTLLLCSYERSSTRGKKERIEALLEVLKTPESIFHLELYKNFCGFLLSAELDKKDVKKLIELVIYVEDFRLQALLLDLLFRFNLSDIIQDYSSIIKKNKNYSFVYFDKYFPHLKNFFVQKTDKVVGPKTSLLTEEDLRLVQKIAPLISNEEPATETEEEALLIHLVRLQSFSCVELLDIAVSFLQSELYRAALHTADLASQNATLDEERLKGSYLKVTCLLKLGDYRAALDHSLEALKIAKTQNDVLSFLYAQAEAHLRLGDKRAAKIILKKIISIDAGYRLARERLEQLNAF
jgi:hypothetical protein